ncbi:MAG: malto-oligosyltrehalose trehalohydrolase [Thermodesulfobacteriota bacterium]
MSNAEQHKWAKFSRRLPIGAEILPEGGVHFRVWAPRRQNVSIILEGGPGSITAEIPVTEVLIPEEGGYFSGLVVQAGEGTLYRFKLDGDNALYPDPASRFQPEGPLGPSQVIDPLRFKWTDKEWRGKTLHGQVIYEIHIGTFTREGTWDAAGHYLEELADVGMTILEIMPVADFGGRFGWGYDGVDLYAPTRLYGSPDDFRLFVDRAHAAGLGVILDVVYNHVGPVGNFLRSFSLDYFTDRYKTDWGEAINYDGKNSGPVREFYISNAGYWISEFHLDGLRLDGTQEIIDRSPEHVVAEITKQARKSAGECPIVIVAENEPEDVRLIRSAPDGGFGLDALWNDDFHHSATVALLGRNEAYYTDHLGTPQEFISAVKWGFLYQGQYYSWQQKRRGTPTFGLEPEKFINYIQNHDQVANSAKGERCHLLTTPAKFRAMTTLFLLAPQTPMIFQGQEFCASAPFCYFADLGKELGEEVRKGRIQFLEQFRSLRSPDIRNQIPDPIDPQTFERCKLDRSERERHLQCYLLYRDLLKLRRSDPVFQAQRADWIHGAVLGADAFVLRFFGQDLRDRLLLFNFGRDLRLVEVPEPLLAPPEDSLWEILWSSEFPRYGGNGTPEIETEESWLIPGHSAVILAPKSIVLLYKGERFFE